MSSEPIRLKAWVKSASSHPQARLYTCGRPGRATYQTKKMPIPIRTIDEWVNGLPNAEVLHIVSLLGEKMGGYSEFNYYPFRSSKVPGEEPTFEEWLNGRYDRQFKVHEFPTIDAVRGGIPHETIEAVITKVQALLDVGSSVLVLDSGGVARTATICQSVGYKPRGYG